MKRLTRIIFVQWYLFDSIEIPINGNTAIIGGNGAGKSSILDGVQVVLCGGDKNKISLNKGSNEKSSRSIREYCLGVVSDPNGTAQIQPRDKANSYIVLCFQDDETNEYTCAGVSIWASATEPKEDIKGWFITRGSQLSVDDFTEETSEGVRDLTWERAKDRLQRKFVLGDTLEFPHKGPGDFRRKFYTTMSAEPGMPANADTVVKSLLAAIAFKPISDPTKFVRENMLDYDNINIRELRDSLKFWRDLRDKAVQTKGYIAALKKLEGYCEQVTSTELDIRHHEHASLAARIEMCYEKASPAQVELDEINVKLEELITEEESLTTEKDLRQKELWQRQSDLEAQDVTRKIQQLEDEQNIRRRTLRETINALAINRTECLKLQSLEECGPSVPAELKSVVDKILKMATVDEGLMAGLWPEKPTEFDCAIRDVLSVARTALPSIKQKENQLWQRIIPLQKDIAELRARIVRMGKGISPVGSKTTGLIELLQTNRIEAKPLCDLINITDEKWRGAIESILGNVREALIVDPGRAKEAIRIYRHEGKNYRGSHVVNTTKTDEWNDKCQKGSLAELISTEDEHARAFINLRLGNIIRVETETELTRHNRAATADLMLNSGGTVKSLFEAEPILGWKQQADIKKRLEHKLKNEEADLDRHTSNQKRLENAGSCIQSFINKFESSDETFAEIASNRIGIEKRLDQIRKEIELLSHKEDSKLRQIVQGLEITVSTLAGKIKEVELSVAEKREWRGRLKETVEEQERTAKIFAEQLDAMINDADIDPATASDILEKLRDKFANEDDVHMAVVNNIEASLDKKRGRVDKAKESAVIGLQAFLGSYSAHSLKLGVGELAFETFEEKAEFITSERERLEETTLADYSGRAEKALAEVESTFRTKFISRLIEKIDQVKQNLDGLNKVLKKRPFHGETYQFRALPNAELKDVLEFAKAVQNDMTAQNVGGLFDPANDPTSPHWKAINFLNQAFQDDNAAKLIQDYRNYFTFNVEMFDKAGNKIADLKHRIAKGSGGENMAPFYVAIGASLSSAYKIVKRANGTAYGGMHLAPFDEAFSKLDAANCYNCLEFLKDVDLQVLLAAPDEKYPTLAAQVDTVLWIYRDGGDIEVEAEFLTRKAHELLQSDNPFVAKEISEPMTSTQDLKTHSEQLARQSMTTEGALHVAGN